MALLELHVYLRTNHWVQEDMAVVLGLTQLTDKLPPPSGEESGGAVIYSLKLPQEVGEAWFHHGKDAAGQKQYIHHS